MRFFRIIGIFLILSVITLTTNRCYRCDTTSIEYSILSFSFIELSEEYLKWLNEHIYPLECRTDFGVNVRFKTEQNRIADYKPANSFFIQSAYAARECIEPKYYPLDSIVSIQIFADRDFGETHSAGTDISEFFKIHGLKFDFPALVSLENFYKHTSIFLDNHFMFNCVLVPVAVEAGEYEFTFVVELSDERTLTQSIKAVLK